MVSNIHIHRSKTNTAIGRKKDAIVSHGNGIPNGERVRKGAPTVGGKQLHRQQQQE